MPQDREYICVSKLVKDVSVLYGKKLKLVKFFNPVIRLFSKKIYFFNKVFGNITYDKNISSYYDYKYCVISYEEAL